MAEANHSNGKLLALPASISNVSPRTSLLSGELVTNKKVLESWNLVLLLWNFFISKNIQTSKLEFLLLSRLSSLFQYLQVRYVLTQVEYLPV
jgi:hypothetical protein